MPHTAPARHSKSSWPASGLPPASQQQICTGCLGYASRCFWRLHCICFMPFVDAAMTCTALHQWLCSTVVIPLCSLRHVQRWLCNRLHIREKKAPVDVQSAQRPDNLIWIHMPCRDLVLYVQLKREREHRAALQQELEALKRGLGRGRATAVHSQPHQAAEAARWSPSRSALFPQICRPLRL